MPKSVPLIRLFLSSPGDVHDERSLAKKVILERLPYDPAFRGKVALEIVAWDSAGSPAMEANMTPQAAINAGLPMPSDCDIVIVIFWSRMGTPMQLNGVDYRSGTHFEYEDAIKSSNANGKPRVLLYRRMSKPQLDIDDTELDGKRDQYQRVKDFFADFTDKATGQIKGGYNPYETPDDFRELLEGHLKGLLTRLLNAATSQLPTVPDSAVSPLWEGSPFPGLRAFAEPDEPIFFGRGRETDSLLRLVADQRFVAVMGASGSGKSSLVGAGLVPRLRGNALPGSQDWRVARFTPGADPFAALYHGLESAFPENRPSPFEVSRVKNTFIDSVKADPHALLDTCAAFLDGKPDWVEVLLFVDQFEELFTLSRDDDRPPFIALLEAAAAHPRLRVVITVRADFYHRCIESPALAALLARGTYPLSAPSPAALYEMIVRPADRAGLEFEAGLPEQILDDTGLDPGALALMAYILDELYEKGKDGKKLTDQAYEALGRVPGAIGVRSEAVYNSLSPDAQAALPRVFRELVEVDERGTATRKRATLSKVAPDDPARELVARFTAARLLVADADANADSMVEVAHEALLRNWSRLAAWIEETQDDLRLLRQVRLAADEWERSDRRDDYLWSHERLDPVYAMSERLSVTFEPPVSDFILPEAERLLLEFQNPNTRLYRRPAIVDRWLKIGEFALPFVEKAFKHYYSQFFSVLNDPLDNFISIFRAFPQTSALLLQSLNDDHEKVRRAAAQALGRLEDASAVAPLIDRLNDANWLVRYAAAEALGQLEDASAVVPLIDRLTDAEGDVRRTAASALGKLGNASVVAPLIERLDDDGSSVRRAAAEALGRLGDTAAVMPLIECLTDEDVMVRSAAAEALGQLGDSAAVAPLIKCLNDADINVRRAAAESLALLGDKSGETTLVEVLSAKLRNPFTRYDYIAAALRKIGTPAALAAVQEWEAKNPPSALPSE